MITELVIDIRCLTSFTSVASQSIKLPSRSEFALCKRERFI